MGRPPPTLTARLLVTRLSPELQNTKHLHHHQSNTHEPTINKTAVVAIQSNLSTNDQPPNIPHSFTRSSSSQQSTQDGMSPPTSPPSKPPPQSLTSTPLQQSLRIVPASGNTKTFTHTTQNTSAPSAPGLHDTLRHGVGQSPYDAASNVAASAHPLEARLKNWEATQESLKMESLRRTFGIAEPVRRGMELKMVRDSEWRPLALGNGLPSVHEDILKGKDDTLTWEDVFTGEESRAVPGVLDEMERKLKI